MAVTYDPIHGRWKSTRDGGESYFDSQAAAEAYDRPPQPGEPGSVGGPPVISPPQAPIPGVNGSPSPYGGGGSYGGGGGGSGSMTSLLSAEDRYRQDQADERDRELARIAEANRVAMATADRLSKEGLSAAEIAARMAELKTGAQLTDQNAANAAARAEASRMAMLDRIPGLLQTVTGGSFGGGGAAPPGTDPTAANDATFNAAKDKTGAISRGSMTALREGGAERGILGSGVEGGGMASLLNEGTKRLADVNRQQTISGVDTQNQMANRNYAGNIQKRGQDLGVSSSILSLLGSRAY